MSKAKIPVSLRGTGRPRHETMVAAAVGLAISGAAGAASAQSGPSEMPQAEAVRSETPQSSGSPVRSEEHTSELQSLMRISYAVFCLKKKNNNKVKQRQTN